MPVLQPDAHITATQSAVSVQMAPRVSDIFHTSPAKDVGKYVPLLRSSGTARWPQICESKFPQMVCAISHRGGNTPGAHKLMPCTGSFSQGSGDM